MHFIQFCVQRNTWPCTFSQAEHPNVPLACISRLDLIKLILHGGGEGS